MYFCTCTKASHLARVCFNSHVPTVCWLAAVSDVLTCLHWLYLERSERGSWWSV